MIISLNWLKKFTNIDVSVDELVTLIGARLVEIEQVIDSGAKYSGVLVVRAVKTEKLEGSDHLSVVKIDDGGVVPDIERDENGLIQVVCGAPNIETAQTVAWLPPKSIVPNTYNSIEQIVLDSRPLRGVISNGMIASAKELDLFDEHDGILVLDENIKPGTLFSDAYELNDYLFDIENKSLTHRPDTFGIIGFAREVAAIQGNQFITPDWLLELNPGISCEQSEAISLKITVDDAEICSRYLAVVVSGADSTKQSPLTVQTYLSRVGIRPINAVVDVTNYLMMLTGQPLHAFDYDKLVAVGGGSADIHVRVGRDGERLELLDGRTIEVSPGDIVIAAGETAIGLAGAMGGASTAIDANTKNIIIESATFNLYNLRGTQMRHGIFSEAITRFTKGQPANLTIPVLADAVRLMDEWAGAKCISKVVEAYPVKQEQPMLDIKADSINGILGSNFALDEIITTLCNAEFRVEYADTGVARLAVPYWRADVHIIEDIAEEVGRLKGFDNIAPVLPTRDFIATKPEDFDMFRSRVRKIMVKAGSNEVLTYSFVNGDILAKAIQDVAESYRIVNSISPDLQYYRQTLTPSLLGLVHPNVKQGFGQFSLFEINKTHPKQYGLTDEGVPVESDKMGFVITSENEQSGAPYYRAKRVFDYLCKSLGVVADYTAIQSDSGDLLHEPFEYCRSAVVSDIESQLPIGIVGEYKKSVTRGFKLPKYSAGFEIDIRALYDIVAKLGNSYKPLSRYPVAERDICFKVNNDIEYRQIINALEQAKNSIEFDTVMTPIDIYQPADKATKNITIRLQISSRNHTLSGDEVSAVVSELAELVALKTRATVV